VDPGCGKQWKRSPDLKNAQEPGREVMMFKQMAVE
jgi:hypothetical protein